MKMVITLACGFAMMCNFAAAQDTTLAKIEKTRTSKDKVVTDVETQVLVVEEASAEKLETTFTLPDNSGKHSILNNKVGPNGETLLMKKNRYYYIDGTGKKVKASRIDVTDKPKSS